MPTITAAAANAPAQAREAGLRWVNDAAAGIRRVPARSKAGFSYRDAKGQVVRDAEVLARIRQLAVPPAWQDVWICAQANGHLQATGRDQRGRKQYRYHADWQAGRGQSKFESLQQFGAVLPQIRARVQRALAGDAEPTRSRVLATLVRLLDTTWLRIGNAEYQRQNGSYGLSTLKRRHVDVRGDELMLSFVGKSGVRHAVRLSDRRVARVLRRCRALPGQELFRYVDDEGQTHTVDSSDVNAWLAEAAGRAGVRVTAKDFRTWHGSVLALQLTLAACVEGAPCSKPQQVLDVVAHRLGNTVAVCRKAYVHPRVLGLGEALPDEARRAQLRAAPWLARVPAKRGLTLPERQLLALLKRRAP